MSADHNPRQAALTAGRKARPWVNKLAHFGYAAKGVVYATVGILALRVALHLGGQTTNSQGALYSISQQPFGRLLLGVVAVGLIGYALWKLIQAVLDPEQKGTDIKGVLKRLGYALSGFAYGGLAITALRIVTASGSQGSGKTASPQDWTAKLLAQPFGQWLVGLVGLVIIGLGLYEIYIALTAKFRKKLRTDEMSPTEDMWISRAGRLGYAARGIVLGIIGGFFIQAALQSNPRQAGGMAQALNMLAGQPYGRWLLGLVATGLIAYGCYAIAEARYRRISV